MTEIIEQSLGSHGYNGQCTAEYGDRKRLTLHCRYMNRPDELDSLSLQDVFKSFYWRAGTWRKRRQSTKVIVRTFPRLSPNPDGPTYEDYCRIKVLLHHPFRRQEDLLTGTLAENEQPWRDIFSTCCAQNAHPKDTLRCWEKENGQPEEDDEDEEINPDIAELDEADWQVYAHIFPNAAVPVYDLDDLGRRPLDDGWDLDASRARWDHVDRMASYLANKRREEAGNANEIAEETAPIELGTLEDEQRRILERFVAVYMAILNGEDVSQARLALNIDGTAGCGKTYLIRAISPGARTCETLRYIVITL